MRDLIVDDMELTYSGPGTELLYYTYPMFFTDDVKETSLILFAWDSCIYSAELNVAINAVRAFKECPTGVEPTEVSCAFELTLKNGEKAVLILSDDGYYFDDKFADYDITNDIDEILDNYDFGELKRENIITQLYC